MKYLTPEILREAQTYLWDAHEDLDLDKTTVFSCWAIDKTCNTWYGKEAKEYAALLYRQGAIRNINAPLFEFQYHYKEKQYIRFMLLELTALMLEDGAL